MEEKLEQLKTDIKHYNSLDLKDRLEFGIVHKDKYVMEINKEFWYYVPIDEELGYYSRMLKIEFPSQKISKREFTAVLELLDTKFKIN